VPFECVIWHTLPGQQPGVAHSQPFVSGAAVLQSAWFAVQPVYVHTLLVQTAPRLVAVSHVTVHVPVLVSVADVSATPVSTTAVSPPAFAGASLLNAQAFQLQFTGSPHRAYALEISTNLIDWLPWSTITMDISGSFSFTDAVEPSVPARFYRLRSP